jgi:hypothetical protein
MLMSEGQHILAGYGFSATRPEMESSMKISDVMVGVD